MSRNDRLEVVYENRNSESEIAEGNIQFSLYETQYVNAVRNIFHNALCQKDRNEENRSWFFNNETKNIITFIGERGSGKTTAMNEFCRILGRMEDKDKKLWWVRHTLDQEEAHKLEEKKFKFYVTNPIDASLLSEKDDLFELILVNIYKLFQDDLENDVNRYQDIGISKVNEVIQRFQELLEVYHMSQESKLEKLHSAFSLMNYMAGSYDIQKKVSRLIDALLKLKDHSYDFEYIVTVVDDLDLNLRHGYQMLQLIQKYFSYGKIIIITAIDYKQMGIVCEEYLKEEIFGRRGIDSERNNEHIRKLANDYMTKIFLFSQRVYMPDMKKSARKLRILEAKDKEKREYAVKEYIMLKIARKMRIFYDACGLKRHFCELNTIRELASYNAFLELLDTVDYNRLVRAEILEEGQKETNLGILRDYDRNHEQFHRDIVVRLTQSMLTPSQRDIFVELDHRDLERRASYFVSVQLDKYDSSHLFIGKITEEGYAYGDLLQKIYQWGREYFEMKPMISCVLASFTCEMVREYLNYRYSPDSASRNVSKKRILGFLGDSFANQWCAIKYPKVERRVNISLETAVYGYKKNVAQESIEMMISVKKLQEIKEGTMPERVVEKIKAWIEEEKIVETLECMDLFVIRKTENGFAGIDYMVDGIYYMDRSRDDELDSDLHSENSGSLHMDVDDKVPSDYEKCYLKIRGKGEPVTLDIMAFVLKSIDYKVHKEKIQEDVIQILKDAIEKYIEFNDRKIIPPDIQGYILLDDEIVKEIETAIISVVKERSLFQKYMNDDFSYEVAFPFYDLDMAYNMWKRTRRAFVMEKIEPQAVFAKIMQFIDKIEHNLEKEENFYSKDDPKMFQYKDNFNKCPYVQALREQEENGIVAQRIMDAMKLVADTEKVPEEVED